MKRTDDETELRTRFARAADEISVGPPPTGDSLREGADRAERRHRTWGTVVVAAAAGGIVAAVAVVSSQLDAGSEESAAPPADASASDSPPERMRLDCPNRFRTSTTIDQWERGAASPAAAVKPIVNRVVGETVRVIERKDRTSVWILRSDGTARARFNVNHSANNGWTLGTAEWCGKLIVPPGKRP